MGIDPWGTAGLTSWDLLREQIHKEGQVTHKVPGFVNHTRSGEGGVSTVGMRKDTERREWGVSLCLHPERVTAIGSEHYNPALMLRNRP